MKKILLQGDSITDARRDRTNDFIMGYGYATVLSAKLNFEKPLQYNIINRGVSGNRTKDLCERFEEDFSAIQPDYMSILIGVNDVWHKYQTELGLDATQSEFYYRQLLQKVVAQMPNTITFLMEPFVLKGSATLPYWEEFNEQVRIRAAITKSLAREFGLTFVPLQDKFDELQQNMPIDYWLRDGVHPTCAGHQLIANTWIKTLEKLEKESK